jgi:hypothetical protein
VKVQLSDALALLTIFVVATRGFTAPHASRVISVLLGAYLLVFLLSALMGGAENGAKETVQAFLLIAFVFVAFGYYSNHATDRLFVLTSILLLAIMSYNIGWHIAHGKLVGWKELNEPKTIFMLLPLLLLLANSRYHSRAARYLLLLGALAAIVIIFLSGERKAYIFAVVAFVIWNGAGLLRYALPAAAVAVPLLLLGVGLDQHTYLGRQVASLMNGMPGSASDSLSLSSLIDENRPMTLSNAQREYTLRRAHALWREKPLLGIGTNAFSPMIETDESLPADFRVGIHGEFYRALYENGVVGLFLYASLWVAALIHVIVTWKATNALSDPYLNRLKLVILAMFLIYCSVEANKGLTALCIYTIPFLVALRPKPIRVQSGHLQHADISGAAGEPRRIGFTVE